MQDGQEWEEGDEGWRKAGEGRREGPEGGRGAGCKGVRQGRQSLEAGGWMARSEPRLKWTRAVFWHVWQHVSVLFGRLVGLVLAAWRAGARLPNPVYCMHHALCAVRIRPLGALPTGSK